MLSNDLDCCAWGGGYLSSVDGQSYGATWEPPWGQIVPTYGHEMGHSIGLPHSGWVYYAYDSPWDVMSSIQTVSQSSAGRTPPPTVRQHAPLLFRAGDGYIGPHKDFLGWIPAANQVVTDTNSNVPSHSKEALPLASAVKLIKICIAGSPCTGSTAHYYTVEARVKGLGATSQFDNGIPNEGIVIHDVQFGRAAISGPCYFNSQSGWAVPSMPRQATTIRGAAHRPAGLYNAQLLPGRPIPTGSGSTSSAGRARRTWSRSPH